MTNFRICIRKYTKKESGHTGLFVIFGDIMWIHMKKIILFSVNFKEEQKWLEK